MLQERKPAKDTFLYYSVTTSSEATQRKLFENYQQHLIVKINKNYGLQKFMPL